MRKVTKVENTGYRMDRQMNETQSSHDILDMNYGLLIQSKVKSLHIYDGT